MRLTNTISIQRLREEVEAELVDIVGHTKTSGLDLAMDSPYEILVGAPWRDWSAALLAMTCTAVADPSYLRLIAFLDRLNDGYCVDIAGAGCNLRLDLPVFAHNCKPVLTADSAVEWTVAGEFRFPAVDRCLTVAGVNSGALLGAALLLRPCGANSVFFETTSLQRFKSGEDGQVRLKASDLCLAVGDRSAATYPSADRWRTLFVAECSTVPPAHSRWRLSKPGSWEAARE